MLRVRLHAKGAWHTHTHTQAWYTCAAESLEPAHDAALCAYVAVGLHGSCIKHSAVG